MCDSLPKLSKNGFVPMGFPRRCLGKGDRDHELEDGSDLTKESKCNKSDRHFSVISIRWYLHTATCEFCVFSKSV